MALKIIWNNIIDEPTEVIVTPASREPRIGTGLDRVIHAAAGAQLLKARKEFGAIAPGVVRVSPSFGLKARKCKAKQVIHALGPFCERGKLNGTERPLLLGCYLQILCTAVALGAKTVSVPVMSSGKFGMPMEMAMDTAVEAIELFLKAVPKLTVKLVGIDEDFIRYARKRYPALTEERISKAAVAAYRSVHVRERNAEDQNGSEGFATEEGAEYFRKLKLRRDTEGKSFNQLFKQVWNVVKARESKAWKVQAKAKNLKRGENSGYLLSQHDLASEASVGERKIKRYLSGRENTTPPRDTVVRLALAMKLPYEYLCAMLSSCGYPITGVGQPKRDAFILKLYASGKRSWEINAALMKAGMKSL